ncbi:hypothetical protein [Sphingopyxis sp. PET50]|uniref:hypothetical protein n=1 Tax=Sphingopyxis sp. PET50 TaxID=2976533 RepID=UPI0021AF107B|nr:hypothetical protein [Sphingopyxis sp. PET50]
MAVGLPLRPVACVVRANDAIGPRHADVGAEPDKRARQPARRLEAAVDHHPVITDAVPKQQRGAGGDEEERDRPRRDEEGAGDQRDERHATIPRDARRVGADGAGNRIGPGFVDQEIDRMGIVIAHHPTPANK